MQEIGDEIQDAIGALRLAEKKAEVLDICMAPGGYSASALKYSPHAHVTGITLPSYLGGHKVHIPYGPRDPRVSVHFTNITMLAAEFGALDIPEDHPDISNLSTKRPWATNSFDGVFCDGQVSRTHAPHIKSYLEQHKAGRLMCSQLILEMQRIKPGGTFVMLLHRVENWRTMKLLSMFDNFSMFNCLSHSHVTQQEIHSTSLPRTCSRISQKH